MQGSHPQHVLARTFEHLAVRPFIDQFNKLQFIHTTGGAIGVLRHTDLPSHVLNALCKTRAAAEVQCESRKAVAVV